MARQIDRKLRDTWRQRLERQRRGTLSVAQFCEREGVSAASFYGWRRRLQGKPPSRTPRSARRVVDTPEPNMDRASAERDAGSFIQVPLATAAASPWIEIVLAEGAVVRLPQQNLAALQAVLQSLRGAPASALESGHA